MQVQTNRDAWVEIDLAAARHNMQLVRQRVGDVSTIIAAVKADAYGHGAVELSRVFLDAGADWLAVSCVDELMQLRKAGVSAPVLLLGHVPQRALPQVLHQQGVVTVYDEQQARQISECAQREGIDAQVHIKVDTGMARLGFSCDEDGALAACRASSLPGLEVSGVFSHFAKADSKDKRFAALQHRRFRQFIDICSRNGLFFELKHFANSAAVCDMAEAWYNGVRPGIMLYGCQPSAEVGLDLLQPVMSVKTRIVRLNRLAAGEPVSYGCTWVAERDSVIATLPLGYADGVSRQLNNKARVLVHGCSAPVRGIICMDQMMIDVTDIPQVACGDEVVLLGEQLGERISAEELAGLSHTISYELLCGFRARLPRIYINA